MRRAISAGLLVAAGLLLSATRLPAQYPASSFYQKETIYLDWNGSRYPGGIFSNQVSARIKFALIDPPGKGWTLDLDARDRIGIQERTTNQLILYSARLTFDKPGSRFYLSLGQMNLYDTAGIGSLLGGTAGSTGRDFSPAPSAASSRRRYRPAGSKY